MLALLFHDVYVRDPGESGFSSPGADRYKLSLAQFDAQLSSLVAADPLGECLTTFDDGGVSFYTIAADRLEAQGRRGHCFVSTNFIGRRGFLDRRQLRDLDARGHVIGSHTASHPDHLDARPKAEIELEWQRSREELEHILGHPVRAASLPGGRLSPTVARAAGDALIGTLFTSEPVTAVHYERACALIGRFAIRCSSPDNLAGRLISSRLARWRQRVIWNAKWAMKPLFGSTYGRLADLLLRRPGAVSHFDRPVH